MYVRVCVCVITSGSWQRLPRTVLLSMEYCYHVEPTAWGGTLGGVHCPIQDVSAQSASCLLRSSLQKAIREMDVLRLQVCSAEAKAEDAEKRALKLQQNISIEVWQGGARHGRGLAGPGRAWQGKT